ncbi:hypothetical protein [Dendrosporobacter sp. 1207_IL3150]|uniref:hypothetical protein n=1 Tax=Dendrosporobacter sp. 1207_IL3150 TaxID=3084054 RepID=UPI002FD8BE8B
MRQLSKKAELRKIVEDYAAIRDVNTKRGWRHLDAILEKVHSLNLAEECTLRNVTRPQFLSETGMIDEAIKLMKDDLNVLKARKASKYVPTPFEQMVKAICEEVKLMPKPTRNLQL